MRYQVDQRVVARRQLIEPDEAAVELAALVEIRHAEADLDLCKHAVCRIRHDDQRQPTKPLRLETTDAPRPAELLDVTGPAVSALRKKLAAPGVIETVPGRGYRLVEP